MILRRTVLIARITLILSVDLAATACSSDPDASAPDAASGGAQGGGGSAVGGNTGNGGTGMHEGGLSDGSAGAGGNAGADGTAGAAGVAVEGGSAGSGGSAGEGGAIEGGAFDAEASTPDHCGGFGASQIGCPCATEGQYSCYQAGDGLDCMGGVWTHLIDGPCWPTDASNCTDQVAGCKCPLLRQRICVNGQGLECFLAGRWRSDPAGCGDSSTPPD